MSKSKAFIVAALALGGIWFAPAGCLLALALAYPLWSWRRLEATISYLGREDLLNDVPNSMNYTFGMPYYNGNSHEIGFFAQDDWRVTPKLVINLGVRYDAYSAIVARGFDSKSGAGLFNLDGLRDNKVHRNQ